MTLVVDALSCARGGVPILTGVGFALAPGEGLVLRGPNGSGKTTLLRALAGLTPPVAGRIDAPEDAIAYAGHADGLKAQLSVAENLAFWAGVFGGRDISAAVEGFDLAGLLDRRAGNLSAGQKRRLSLARLLVTGRPIWCLDEPTVSLDTENVARFGAAVRGHLDAGGIAVIATHIDLGLEDVQSLDITPFIARTERQSADPFLSEGAL